ncbi:MAG: thiamine phosphate synthase [candidate division KSB1 bacterium]|jgi:thiamine-phosphate pyrophosphorylase|nr:thiamine phosphate synthase [candidate division KSB1 bacterium]
MNQHISNWHIYLITDELLSHGRSHAEVARLAIEGGADVIQLRDKTASSRKLYDDATAIRQLTRDAGVTFIMNDRLDIALACDADGLHVGQKDIPATIARSLLPAGKILGVSAESVFEALAAEKDGADYLGVGPVFDARGTKPDASAPTGLHLLSDIRSRTNLPVIAIGGINHENTAHVIQAGAHGIAVISAIVSAEDIKQATSDLKGIVTQERSKIDGYQ